MCQPAENQYEKIAGACGKGDRKKRERCVRKTDYVNTNTFSGVFFFFFFHLMRHLFILQVALVTLLKSSQTGKLENARNVFWETSFEYRLLPIAVSG